MGISERLKSLRKEQGLTQKELAEKSGIPVRSIINYENSQREPNSKAMAALEQYFNVSGRYLRGETDDPSMYKWDDKETMDHVQDILSTLGAKVVEAARSSDRVSKKMAYNILIELKHVLSMDTSEKTAAMMILQETVGITTGFIDGCLFGFARDESRIDEVIRNRVQEFAATLSTFKTGDSNTTILWEDVLEKLEANQNVVPLTKSVPSYDVRVSAGMGTFLDSSDYELIDLPIDAIPIQTTFCVTIYGDSMMPDYKEADLLFVKQQPTIEPGELGIFLLNGDAYFKKYVRSGNQLSLHSLNQEYEPIPIAESDEFRVIGKVLGKYQDLSTADNGKVVDDVIPEVYTAARDGGGFERVTDPDQAKALSKVIRQRKKSNKKLP